MTKEPLLAIEKTCRDLASMTRVDEVKKIRDKTLAFQAYLRQQKASAESQFACSVLRVRTEIKLGQLTTGLDKAPGPHNGGAGPGRGKKTSTNGVEVFSKEEWLEEQGLSPPRVREWQRMARREDRFERIVEVLEKHVRSGSDERAMMSTSLMLAAAALDDDRFDDVLIALEDEPVLKKAIGAFKLAKKQALARKLRKDPKPTPDGRYHVVAIDPPWRYDTRAEDSSHRGKNPYPDMTVEEISALPVADLAQKDCVLWLWTTNAFMRDAFDCLDAWGFEHKTILTWDKVKLGLGDWLRNVTEHCLMAVKGKPLVTLTNQTTIIREPRREHSRKPTRFYELVDELCPGSKLEMFSREDRDGWDSWGAESGKFSEAAS